MMKLKELYEKKASLLDEAKRLADLENPNEEDERKFDEASEELQKLEKNITRAEKKEEIRKMTAKTIEDEAEREEVSKEEMEKRYQNAFRTYLMGRGLSEEQEGILQRANAQNTTDATGGYTIPQGFSNMIEKAMLYYMPFNEDLVRIWRTASGNDVKYPTVNDTSNKGYLIAEAGDATSSATAVTFADLTFKAYKFTSGMLQVSYELVQDSAFDIATLLADIFAERMGRILTEYFTTGTGSSQPQGVVTGAGTGATASAAAAISRDDIVNLIHSLDPNYRKNGTLMFNDNTLAAIKKLSLGTADDRPLYQVSAIAGEPDRIEGYPFVVNDEMADIGASNVSMLFGDFKKFVVRLVGQERVKVSTEVFAKTDELGMAMFKRVDSKVLDAGIDPIVKLTHPSS